MSPPAPAPSALVPVEDVVSRARAVADSGTLRPLAARRRALGALRDLLVDNAAQFREALRADLGKGGAEADVTEIDVTIHEAVNTLRHLRAWTRTRPVRLHAALLPGRARLLREPLGVVVIVSPWNYPLQLMLDPAVGALAAGNAVIVKPSSRAPHVAGLTADLVARAFPGGELQVVTGPTARAAALVAQRVDHILFTGSARVGAEVLAAAAPHLVPVTLELGGKSPVWFDDDRHVDAAARRLAWAKFTNAGQTCIAPDYVMTTPERVPALVRALDRAITDLWGPDPRSSTEYGRIVDDRAFDRLVGLLPGGPGDGEVVIGGDHDRASRRFAPTVLVLPVDGHPVVGPASPHPVMRGEIFGPILPILPVASPEEAVRVIDDWGRPLALHVFSASRATRRLFERRTSSGAVVHGAGLVHAGADTLPFGGVGSSGMGHYHGRYSVETFSHVKPVLTMPLRPDTLRLAQPGAPAWVHRVVSTLQRR